MRVRSGPRRAASSHGEPGPARSSSASASASSHRSSRCRAGGRCGPPGTRRTGSRRASRFGRRRCSHRGRRRRGPRPARASRLRPSNPSPAPGASSKRLLHPRRPSATGRGSSVTESSPSRLSKVGPARSPARRARPAAGCRRCAAASGRFVRQPAERRCAQAPTTNDFCDPWLRPPSRWLPLLLANPASAAGPSGTHGSPGGANPPIRTDAPGFASLTRSRVEVRQPPCQVPVMPFKRPSCRRTKAPDS